VKIVTIEIDENGDQTAEADGYHGKGCSEVLTKFADAVGKATKVTRKSEYNQAAVKQNILKR
jgi:hypothetical protein